ncbi:Transcriptional activator hac1 [Micractinium conductrix]|uniref:Transcriptional activator hac1 n=1 Tax=Micractinium conductrix TaxID=554055 RepID=A0A2P6V755_9CHLO|nr:Transcriptional activator hac1 [Micractinium conductrix]|eukprot:PSC69913.1 Transcriptional activator hac1 [Micractinium conductrix]
MRKRVPGHTSRSRFLPAIDENQRENHGWATVSTALDKRFLRRLRRKMAQRRAAAEAALRERELALVALVAESVQHQEQAAQRQEQLEAALLQVQAERVALDLEQNGQLAGNEALEAVQPGDDDGSDGDGSSSSGGSSGPGRVVMNLFPRLEDEGVGTPNMITPANAGDHAVALPSATSSAGQGGSPAAGAPSAPHPPRTAFCGCNVM